MIRIVAALLVTATVPARPAVTPEHSREHFSQRCSVRLQADPVLVRLKPDTTYCRVVKSAPGQQVPLEQSLTDLASPGPRTRRRAGQMLKDEASADAAIPLAKLVVDSQDQIQLEAIAAELNTFLADPIVTRRRVGLVVEMRKTLA